MKIYNYPDLVEYALGPVYKQFFNVIQAFLNLAFTFGPLTFFMKTLHNFANLAAGEETHMEIFLAVTIVVFAPLAWVRTVETF